MTICTRASLLRAVFAFAAVAGTATHLHAQDNVFTGTNTGADRVRIAAADFRGATPDAMTLKQTFDTVLYSDLGNAGVFDLVSKSLQPQATPARRLRFAWRTGAAARRMQPS